MRSLNAIRRFPLSSFFLEFLRFFSLRLNRPFSIRLPEKYPGTFSHPHGKAKIAYEFRAQVGANQSFSLFPAHFFLLISRCFSVFLFPLLSVPLSRKPYGRQTHLLPQRRAPYKHRRAHSRCARSQGREKFLLLSHGRASLYAREVRKTLGRARRRRGGARARAELQQQDGERHTIQVNCTFCKFFTLSTS